MSRLTLLFILLLLPAGLAGCTTTGTPATQAPDFIEPFLIVPYQKTDDGLYTIDVQLNGDGPYRFLIDTGATISVVFEDTAEALVLPLDTQDTTMIHGIVESQSRPVVTLSSLTVGTIEKQNMRVAILKNRIAQAEVQGILGLDFLRDHALIFDHEASVLKFTVSDHFAASQYRDWNYIRLLPNPYREEGYGLVFINMRYARYRNPALLDLGASFSVANWAAARGSQFERIRSRLRQNWELEGAIGTFKPTTNVRMSRVYAGEHTWYNQVILVLDLDTLNLLGTEDKPLILAGADLFEDTSFAIDFSGERLYVKPNAAYLRQQAEDSQVTGSRIPGRTGSGQLIEIPLREERERNGEDENRN